MTSYAQKLKDPRWQRKRLEILERDEWMCSHCATTTRTLHVHHLRYPESRNPWDSPAEDLLTLCDKCHKSEEIERSPAVHDLAFALKDSGLPIETISQLTYLVEHLGGVIAESTGPRINAIWEVTCGLDGFMEMMLNEKTFSRISRKTQREYQQIGEEGMAMANAGCAPSSLDGL